MLKWKIDVLKALKNKGYNQRYLIDYKIISANSLTVLRKNQTNISLATLDKLCKLLECQPYDLLEFVPDEN